MFAVARNGDRARQNNLAALLLAKPQSATVDSCVRPHVPGRTAGDGVVLAIEFSGPLAVHGRTAAISAVNRDLSVVAGRFVNHRIVLGRAGSELRLCFVQFPGAHVWAVGGTYDRVN